MSKQNHTSFLDHPDITRILFHPRKDPGYPPPASCADEMIPVADDISVNGRFYLAGTENPHIIFFHGNGEIASDYDDIGPIYNQHGLNFLVVDYRGYGKSGGSPNVSALLNDVHPVFSYIREWMNRKARTGPIWIMGRSLGSAAALELASHHSNECSGLIIESGFAHTVDLLSRIGIDTRPFADKTDAAITNVDKIAKYNKPTLIIHAEHDHIIPLSHGKDLYERSPAAIKDLQIINGADHNTIFYVAGITYFSVIKSFVDQASDTART